MDWEQAPDVRRDLEEILTTVKLEHIKLNRVFVYRTNGSKAKAYARTWGFPKIFQDALQVEPAYVIEVLAKYYDKLDDDQKKKILIHELLHIPKNFSGALLPHTTRHRSMNKEVSQLFKEYKKNLTEDR